MTDNAPLDAFEAYLDQLGSTIRDVSTDTLVLMTDARFPNLVRETARWSRVREALQFWASDPDPQTALQARTLLARLEERVQR